MARHRGERPLLLLDVDGVLNPYGWRRLPAGYEPHALFACEQPVAINPDHGVWIAEAARLLDLAWVSSWNDEANRWLAPLLGIPPLPVVAMPTPPFEAAEKVPLVAAYAGERPTAWIDDLHGPEATAWADDRIAPTLLVSTDPAVGLTRPVIDRVLGWANRLNAG